MDGSGKEQIVEAQYEGGKLYPVRGRSKLSYVFPWIPKKFPTYEAYAHATVGDIFPANTSQRQRAYEANELSSGVYFQRADGTFEFKPLPSTRRFPDKRLRRGDLDGDGIPDVYCVGNNYGPEPSTGRFDGGVGLLLKGDGHGGLTPVPAWQSGLLASGDARAAVALALPGDKGIPPIVASQCNGPVLFFTPNPKPIPATRPLVLR